MKSAKPVLREINDERTVAVVEFKGNVYSIVCEPRTPTESQVYLVGSDDQKQFLAKGELIPGDCPAIMERVESDVLPLIVTMVL